MKKIMRGLTLQTIKGNIHLTQLEDEKVNELIIPIEQVNLLIKWLHDAIEEESDRLET